MFAVYDTQHQQTGMLPFCSAPLASGRASQPLHPVSEQTSTLQLVATAAKLMPQSSSLAHATSPHAPPSKVSSSSHMQSSKPAASAAAAQHEAGAGGGQDTSGRPRSPPPGTAAFKGANRQQV